MGETVTAVLPSGARVTGPAELIARMGGEVEPAPSASSPKGAGKARAKAEDEPNER